MNKLILFSLGIAKSRASFDSGWRAEFGLGSTLRGACCRTRSWPVQQSPSAFEVAIRPAANAVGQLSLNLTDSSLLPLRVSTFCKNSGLLTISFCKTVIARFRVLTPSSPPLSQHLLLSSRKPPMRSDWRERHDVRAVALDLDNIALNGNFVQPSGRADLPALFGSRFPAHDQLRI